MTFTSDSLLAERYQLQQRLGNTAIGRQTWLATPYSPLSRLFFPR